MPGVLDFISKIIFPYETARREREEKLELLKQLERKLDPSDDENEEEVPQPIVGDLPLEDSKYFRAEGRITAWNQNDGFLNGTLMFAAKEVEINILERLQVGIEVIYLGEKTEESGNRIIRIESIKERWGTDDVSIQIVTKSIERK